MKKEKLILIALAIIITAIIILLTYFRYSYKYTEYQLIKALRNGDTTLALQYYNIEKIVDNKLDTVFQKEKPGKEEKNSKEYQALRKNLIETVDYQLKKAYDTKMHTPNGFASFIYIMTNKSVIPFVKLKYNKLNKNTVIKTQCEVQTNTCTELMFERIGNKWVITLIDF